MYTSLAISHEPSNSRGIVLGGKAERVVGYLFIYGGSWRFVIGCLFSSLRL